MPAYKVFLSQRTCDICGVAARYEVFNTYNAKCGDYCKQHAAKKVEELNKGDKIDA